MPEEQSTEQQPAGEEQAEQVEETAPQDPETETEDTSADSGDAQEAEQQPEKDDGFDKKKYEAELRKKNSEAKNLRERLKKLEPLATEYQKLQDAQKSESERLNEQLAEANRQVEAIRTRAVKSEVRAMAANSFADPDDAASALDLPTYVDSDGEIDTAAIEADLAELLQRKPHWAKPAQAPPQEGPRRPAPDRTQASGAKQTRTQNPADEFAGFLKSRLKTGR